MGLPVVVTGVYPPAGGEAFVARAEGEEELPRRDRARRSPPGPRGDRRPPRLRRHLHLGPPAGGPARRARRGAAAGGREARPVRGCPEIALKVLFVYKYLTLGGVEAVLRARLDGLGRRRASRRTPGSSTTTAAARSSTAARTASTSARSRSASASPAASGSTCSARSTPRRCSPASHGRAGAPAAGDGMPFGLPRQHRVPAGPRRLPAGGGLHPLRGAAAAGPASGWLRGSTCGWSPTPCARSSSPTPTPFPAPPPRPVVAWIGRLDDHKNWRGFVEIAGVLGRRGVGARGLDHRPADRGGRPGAAAGGGARGEGPAPAALVRRPPLRPHPELPRRRAGLGRGGGLHLARRILRPHHRRGHGAPLRRGRAGHEPLPRVRRAREDRRPLHPRLRHQPPPTAIQELLADAALRAALGRRARESMLARFAPEPALAVLAAELRRLG